MQYRDKSSRSPYTIVGKSLVECEKKLDKLFDHNYKVISYRSVLHGGILGYMQKERVEVSYVLTQPSEKTLPQTSPLPAAQKILPDVNAEKTLPNLGNSRTTSFLQNRDALLQSTNPNITSNLQLGAISKQLERMNAEFNEKLSVLQEASSAGDVHPTVRKIEDLLEQNEFTKSYIKKMSAKIKATFSIDELSDFDLVQAQVVDWIGEDIHLESDAGQLSPGVIILVGPTGVGKTTTIAKMAALVAIQGKENVKQGRPAPKMRLITTDIMRVGATEQLTNWANTIGVEIDKAETLEDLSGLIKSYGSSFDYIFIDTAGYSPTDIESIAHMHKTLSVRGMNASVYLTVTASTKAKDLERIIRNYESFNCKSTIITKIDESTSYGNVLSVLSEKGKSISWITTGQQVLKTIEKASVPRFLMGLDGFKVDGAHIEQKFSNTNK